jgi:hypothetical protein
LLQGANHIVKDELVTLAIGGDRGIEILDPGIWFEVRRPERSVSADESMLERAPRRLVLRVDGEPDGPALHVDDRLVPVAAVRRGGEACDVPRLHLAHDALEGSRGQVVAFVDDHVTVGRDDVVDGPIAHEALEHGHVEASGGRPLPATDLPNRLRRRPEEQRELRHPLIEQRLTMHQDERASVTCRSEVGADDRLPHAGWGDEHAEVMCEQRFRCLLLDFGQMPVEARLQRFTEEALVVEPEANSVLGEQVAQVADAASRESKVSRVLLGAGDDPRRERRRGPHLLPLVELRVLEGREALDLIQERAREPRLLDEDALGENRTDLARQRFLDPRRAWSSGRRGLPGHLVFLFARGGNTQADDLATSDRLLRDRFDRRRHDARQGS